MKWGRKRENKTEKTLWEKEEKHTWALRSKNVVSLKEFTQRRKDQNGKITLPQPRVQRVPIEPNLFQGHSLSFQVQKIYRIWKNLAWFQISIMNARLSSVFPDIACTGQKTIILQLCYQKHWLLGASWIPALRSLTAPSSFNLSCVQYLANEQHWTKHHFTFNIPPKLSLVWFIFEYTFSSRSEKCGNDSFSESFQHLPWKGI